MAPLRPLASTPPRSADGVAAATYDGARPTTAKTQLEQSARLRKVFSSGWQQPAVNSVSANEERFAVIRPMRCCCTICRPGLSGTVSYFGNRDFVPVPTLCSQASSHGRLRTGQGPTGQMTSPRVRTCFSPTRSNWLPPARSVRACARLGRRASPHTARQRPVPCGSSPPHVPVTGPPSDVPARGPKSVRPRGLGRAPPTGPLQALSATVPFRAARPAGRPWKRGAPAPGRPHRSPSASRRPCLGDAPRRRCKPPRWLRRATLCARATGGVGQPWTLRRGNGGGGVRGCPLVRCRASA